jgi:hypothetical protein
VNLPVACEEARSGYSSAPELLIGTRWVARDRGWAQGVSASRDRVACETWRVSTAAGVFLSPRFDAPDHLVPNVLCAVLWLAVGLAIVVSWLRGLPPTALDVFAIIALVPVSGIYLPIGPVAWLVGRNHASHSTTETAALAAAGSAQDCGRRRSGRLAAARAASAYSRTPRRTSLTCCVSLRAWQSACSEPGFYIEAETSDQLVGFDATHRDRNLDPTYESGEALLSSLRGIQGHATAPDWDSRTLPDLRSPARSRRGILGGVSTSALAR